MYDRNRNYGGGRNYQGRGSNPRGSGRSQQTGNSQLFANLKKYIREYAENDDPSKLNGLVNEINCLNQWGASRSKTIFVHTVVSKWNQKLSLKQTLDPKELLIDAGKLAYIGKKGTIKADNRELYLNISELLKDAAEKLLSNSEGAAKRVLEGTYLTTLYLQSKAKS